MKLEAKSKVVLAVTKSKAKMYEFAVDEADHIKLTYDPQELLITTIGILGELAALEARESDSDKDYKALLKSELISVGQYFDALNQSHLADEISIYLKIVGSAAYYLAEMPGSSFVLAKDLTHSTDLLTSTSLEGILIWLLKSDYTQAHFRIDGSYLTHKIDSLAEACRNYFNMKTDSIDLISRVKELRSIVYASGTYRELLFADVITAIVLQKISNSSLHCLPLYTNIPKESWLNTIEKPGFIKEFWPSQKLLGEKGVLAGVSAVVQMPTSSGKTKSTELIIRSAFLSGRADVAVIVAPFRALCREITDSLKKSFAGETVNINELRDILEISDDELSILESVTSEDYREEAAPKSVLVTTPEKLIYLTRHETSLAENLDLLIFDEGHQFDTGRRGVTYELLIATLKSRISDHAQKVMISAVMANANSIGEWLNGEAGVEIQGNNLLPAIRSVAFASWTTRLGQLHYIDLEREADRDFFVPRLIEQVNLGTQGREKVDRLFPKKGNSSSLAAYLGIKLCHQGPVAIFCGAKSSVTTICDLIVEHYQRGLEHAPPSDSSDRGELEKISYLSSLHFGDDNIFTKSIAHGVLPHSSIIPNGIRVSVEWAMESNKAVMVVCTSTLAQGVNLPIKYLIITSTFQAGQAISTRDFHNLIGRAGRAGQHTEGSIIFADTEIYDKRNDRFKSWKWYRALRLLDFENAEDCVSSLKNLIDPFDFELLQTDVRAFIASPREYRQSCVDLAKANALDIHSLLEQMDYKEALISTIESYFLSHLKDSTDVNENFAVHLVENTLAYFLSNDERKAALKETFELISRKVLETPSEKYHYYGRALLGINELNDIEDWLANNSSEIELAETAEDLLRICWPLLIKTSKNKLLSKIHSKDALLGFVLKWIAGDSYSNLHAFLVSQDAYMQAQTQQRAIKIDTVVELGDNATAFDLMLLIGAIADVAEGNQFSEEATRRLRALQVRLRLGLSSNLEVWLYSKGYVDREVCKQLSVALQQRGVSPDSFDFSLLDDFSDVIQSVIEPFPTYFKEQFSFSSSS